MKTLEYSTTINAPRKKVWDTMLEKDTYRQWTSVSWPDSSYDGQWKKGTDIKFVGPDGSGTMAHIEELKEYETISAKHIALLGPNGVPDSTSDFAKEWTGIMEKYYFSESNGKTTVKVVIETNPKWAPMFEEGWPGALAELKALSEKH